MSYRDDHEAALQRMADLEKKLEAERAEHAADEKRVAELEEELAALKKQLSAKPEKPAKPAKAPKPPKPARPDGKKSRWGFLAALPLLPVVAVMSVFTFLTIRGCVRNTYDGTQWLAVATDKARSWSPDAELIGMDGTLIDSSGKADTTHSGRWRFSFRSQALAELPRPAAPPPPLPGAPPRQAPPWPGCQYTCDVSHWRKGGWQINCSASRSDAYCGRSLATPVRCTTKQVWQRARGRGAPDPALANIVLSQLGGVWAWQFVVYDRSTREPHAALFQAALADDCSGP